MSGILVRVALTFGGGLLIGEWVGTGVSAWVWILGAAAATGFAVLMHRRPHLRRGGMLAAVLLLGILRVASDRPFPEALFRRAPHLRQVEGTVVSYPSFGATYATFTIAPDTLPARIRVTWFSEDPPIGAVHVGDRVRLSGWTELPEPFDGFDYPAYLARQGIFATMSVAADGMEPLGEERRSVLRWGDRLRQTILARFDRWLGMNESAMARSLLFGDRSSLPDAIEDAFSRTGLMHLLAVSGLHLGIFLGGAWWIVRRLGLRPLWAYPAVGLLVLLALWVVGPRVSLVRAGLLFAFLALGSVLADVGLILRRAVRPMNGLAAAAIALLALRPGALYDAGFQLTFAATASILIAFSPPFDAHRRLALLADRCGRFRGPARAAMTLAAVSAAAQAGAMPIVAWHFGGIHPLALAANLVVVPLAGVALWCGFGAILLSGTVLLRWAIVPLEVVLIGLRTIVAWLARLPLSQVAVPNWMAVWLGALVLFTYAAAAYSEGGSSWTRYSTSIVFGSVGRSRDGRPL